MQRHVMQVFGLLVDKVKGIDGARVENNKFCVSVHYRNVNEKVENFNLLKTRCGMENHAGTSR